MNKIIIADDHSVTRMGLTLYCKEIKSDVQVFECSEIKQIFDILKLHPDIDLLLLDLFFENVSSIQYIDVMKSSYYLPKTLVVSFGNDLFYGSRAIKEGAKGYINKMASEDDIKNAISNVMNDKYYMSPDLMSKIIENKIGQNSSPFDELSTREFQVAVYILQGLSTTEIGTSMNLSQSTVSTYKNRLFTKLNIERDSELLKLANEYNINFK
jgi:two-component system, NarL family, invasion response regulator UvrY